MYLVPSLWIPTAGMNLKEHAAVSHPAGAQYCQVGDTEGHEQNGVGLKVDGLTRSLGARLMIQEGQKPPNYPGFKLNGPSLRQLPTCWHDQAGPLRLPNVLKTSSGLGLGFRV